MATSTTWRPPLPSPPAYRLAKHDKAQLPRYHHRPRGRDALLHQFQPTCLWATRRTCSPHWTYRTSSRPSTPAARCSTPSWAKSCPTGRLRRRWCVRSRRTTSCPITRCLPPIPSAQNHGYLAGRAVHLPRLRRRTRGLQPHHRLLPPGAELERRQESGVSGQKNLSGERCGAAPCSRSGGKSKRDRARFGESRPLYALCHGHLPQLPGGEAAAAKGGRSL